MHCGSTQCGDSQFCQHCESQLWLRHQSLEEFFVSENKIKGLGLFFWVPDQDRKVSNLMMTLKGGELTDAVQFYVSAFVSRLNCAIPENSVLIPCPATHKNRPHAQLLAKSFSEILQIPAMDVLKKCGTNESQKTKSLKQRQSSTMVCAIDLSDKYVIFIDDIVTTGATAHAAFKAIGACRGFEVWCLAHRRLLAADWRI